MKVCRVRRATEVGLVLAEGYNLRGVELFNECEGERAHFTHFGYILKPGEKDHPDISALSAHGEHLGISKEDKPSILSGRLHVGQNEHNCIIVSFGHGKEFAFYCIDQRNEGEIYRLYVGIRELSMLLPRQQVSA